MTDFDQADRFSRARFVVGAAGMAILVLAIALLFAYFWYARYLNSPAPQKDDQSAVVVIPKGSSVRDIRTILADAGVIVGDFRFLVAARLSGYGMRLQAGEFLLPTGRKPLEVLQILATARPLQHAVTIPEGLRAAEIAEIFSGGGWCDKERFLHLVGDGQFLKKIGFGGQQSLEGYLFPDTYNFTSGAVGAENIIRRMVARFQRIWGELVSGLAEQPDMNRTVILASIVEKETGVAEERAVIAGVFHNRLQRGMPLQSDPTVVYGTQKFGAPITREDLQNPTPYNTYTLTGLPVGPICNPGRAALEAVLSPSITANLYFVAKNDGTHHFSANLAEHNRAVSKYQRKKTAKEGK
ncbi:MAG: endolytic transglycosylase MltG [Desulforhopalus sp.]